MKSIYRFPGGKVRASKIIARYFPKEYNEYREPCVGGGGLFFTIPPNKKRWINDINPDLMSVYTALRDNPVEFIASCKAILPEQEGEPLTAARNGKALYSARLKQVFDEMVKDRQKHPALSYFYINRVCYAGRVNYDIPSRLYFSNPSGWNIVKTNLLEEASKLLQNIKITVGSYEKCLETDGENVFIYIDPPYMKNTLLSRASQLYQHNFTEEDHKKLSEDVLKCKHKVLISYDNHPFIRELYKDLNIYEESWKYCGTSLKEKEVGQELIITNYPSK